MRDELVLGVRDAEKKIKFAEFLMDREDNANFLPAISKHVIEAANLASKAIVDLDEKSSKSPQLVSRALEKLGEGPAEDFSKQYLNIFQLTSKQNLSKQDVRIALNSVKNFVDWMSSEYGTEVVAPLNDDNAPEEPEPVLYRPKPDFNLEGNTGEVAPILETEDKKKKSIFSFWRS